jgi:hypothetical protein
LLFIRSFIKVLLIIPIFKHKNFIHLFDLFLHLNFKYLKIYCNIRGLFLILKGKVGRRGIGRKATFLLNFGNYSLINYKNRIDYNYEILPTSSGVIGLRGALFY